jgi:hypothetical protein
MAAKHSASPTSYRAFFHGLGQGGHCQYEANGRYERVSVTVYGL